MRIFRGFSGPPPVKAPIITPPGVWTRQPDGSPILVPQWRKAMCFCWTPYISQARENPIIGPKLTVREGSMPVGPSGQDRRSVMSWSDDTSLTSDTGVTLLNTSTGDGLGEYTLFVYFKHEATFNKTRGLIGVRSTSPWCTSYLVANWGAGGNLHLTEYDGGTVNVGSSTGHDGNWTTFGVTRRVLAGHTWDVYINGKKTDTDTGTGRDVNLANRRVVIGCLQTGNNDKGDGQIALACMWDRALSAKEMSAIGANPWQIFQ